MKETQKLRALLYLPQNPQEGDYVVLLEWAMAPEVQPAWAEEVWDALATVEKEEEKGVDEKGAKGAD